MKKHPNFYLYAVADKRFYSTMIDSALLLPIFIIVLNLGIVFPIAKYLIFVFPILYFALTEVIFGASVGKLLMNLRVVNRNWEKPNFLQALIRAVFWLVEANPILIFYPFITYYIIHHTKTGQRIGDRISRTYVVSKLLLEQKLQVSYQEPEPIDVNIFENLRYMSLPNQCPNWNGYFCNSTVSKSKGWCRCYK